MERHGGSHWLECSRYLVLLFQIFTPYYADRFEGVLLGGWMDGWVDGWKAYLPFQIFVAKKLEVFYLFFLNVFSY